MAGGIRAGVGEQAGLESDVAGKTLAGTGAAAGGIASLFNTSTGEVSDMGRQILAQYGLSDADQATQIQTLTQLANTPGWFDRIMQVGGMAAGVAGGLGGFGGAPRSGGP